MPFDQAELCRKAKIYILGKALTVVILFERNLASEEFRASLNDAKGVTPGKSVAS
jgi:hypothetical protein